MKVSIIIAVFNEAPTVAALLERVCSQPLPCAREVIVVESNSTDGSRKIVAQFVARHAGQVATPIRAIYQDRPYGKGHAVRQGIAAASGDIVLIQDADLEYDVADYPDLLKPIIEGRAAFVLGSRHMTPQSWKIRRFAHHSLLALLMNAGGLLFHALFNTLFGVRLSDPTSMFKVFRADCLQGITFSCNRFDFDYELLGKLLRAGYRPLEVPVSYQSRGFDEGKKIRIFRDPATWVYAILKCRLSAAPVPQRRAVNPSAPPRRGPAAVRNASCSRQE